MKITYLSSATIPSRQANSMHIMKICSAFCSIGHNVSLVCQYRKESNIENIHDYYGVDKELDLHRFKRAESIFSLYFFSVYSLFVCFKRRPDLVISRFLLGAFLSSLFFSTVLELHQLPSKNSRIQRHLLKLIHRLPNFKALVVITKPLKDIFIKEGFPKHLISVFPDGADLKKTYIKNENFEQLNQDINLGYTGHLYKGRGIEILIQLAKLSSSYIIHIAGGDEEDINFYKNLIENENIKNIKIHGFIEPSLVFDFCSKMDILLAPYQTKVHLKLGNVTTEKWMSPLKIFEYMSTKKPIICSDIDVLYEVLEHKRNCLLCNPSNVASWDKAVKLLVNDRDLAFNISENAFEDLKTKYSWKVRAEKILSLAFTGN